MNKKCIVMLMSLLLIGCKAEEKLVNIEMHCNGIKTEFSVKSNDILSCKLLEDTYEFKITKIDDSSVSIETNKFGLTDDNNMSEETKSFVLTKDKELDLMTQSMDYQESVIFNWKE